MNINRKEIIKSVSDLTGYTQKDITVVIDALEDVIGTELENGNTVSLGGFAKFRVKEVAARDYRIPSTGEIVSKPSRKSIVIKPLKVLNDRI